MCIQRLDEVGAAAGRIATLYGSLLTLYWSLLTLYGSFLTDGVGAAAGGVTQLQAHHGSLLRAHEISLKPGTHSRKKNCALVYYKVYKALH